MFGGQAGQAAVGGIHFVLTEVIVIVFVIVHFGLFSIEPDYSFGVSLFFVGMAGQKMRRELQNCSSSKYFTVYFSNLKLAQIGHKPGTPGPPGRLGHPG